MSAQSSADRLTHEIEHHRHLAAQHTEEIWGWASPAGRRRAERRAQLFIDFGGIAPGASVLEMGCGTGEFTQRVATAGANLVAVDLSQELLAKARDRVPVATRLIRGDAQMLPFPAETFDVVYGCSILHHLDLEKALTEVRRLLRPRGRLVFSEPNLLNPQVMLMFKCARLKPYFGNSPDEMAFTRGAVSKVLRKLGFDRFQVGYFDFLHPSIPASVLPFAEPFAASLEHVPLLRTISGSLLIRAER